MLKPRVDILLSEYEKLKECEKENQRLKDINFKQEYELENRMMKIDYLECKVERLNNVLNELEKWIKEERDYYFENHYYSDFNAYGSKLDDVLDKLNELKESDK